jgi:diacylglycerol kinase family enzyme
MPFEADGYGCMVTNAAKVGALGMRLAPTIDMGDGRLDVFFLGESRLKTLTELAANLIANVPEAEALWHWAVQEVSIAAEPPQPVEADGELLGETPVSVRVLKQAIAVIVPATV